MRNFGTMALVSGACCLISACSSPLSISPGDGISFRVLDRSYSQVWNAATRTVAYFGNIESEDRLKGEVRGLKGTTGWSWGDAIAIFIDPPDPEARNFIVSAVSEHVLVTQLTGRDFSHSMESAMKSRLDLQ